MYYITSYTRGDRARVSCFELLYISKNTYLEAIPTSALKHIADNWLSFFQIPYKLAKVYIIRTYSMLIMLILAEEA